MVIVVKFPYEHLNENYELIIWENIIKVYYKPKYYLALWVSKLF